MLKVIIQKVGDEKEEIRSDIDYLIANVDLSKVTEEWIVKTYSLINECAIAFIGERLREGSKNFFKYNKTALPFPYLGVSQINCFDTSDRTPSTSKSTSAKISPTLRVPSQACKNSNSTVDKSTIS